MKFHYDPFENGELCEVKPVAVLESFMIWAEEEMSYGKKSRSAFD